ncbi:hypothetical protein KR093_008286 [Drosophila rubida]|uniref:Uncharacterized protein n=1 Tax=Drosophila rubida TaxID=30044 RepID=A0AAD4K0Z0_9MUSC|nr:hypothetical protein KR093_008286 [Drosophila rubida]
MEILSNECNFNPKHFNVFNLSIIEDRVYAEMGTKTKIMQGFKIYLDVELRLQNAKKYNSVFSYNMDICRSLLSLRNAFYKKWVVSILKYGNFSDKCPVLPGYYYLKDFKLEDDLIPGFMFSGDYRIHLKGFYGRFKANSADTFMHCVFIVRLS